MAGIQIKPKYSKQQPQYGVAWPTVQAHLYLKYTETGGVQTDELLDSTYSPGWKEPPDLTARLVIAERTQTLLNGWSRDGTHFDGGSGVAMLSVSNLSWQMWYEDPWSIQNVRFVNPFPFAILCKLWGLMGDETTGVGDEMQILVAAGGAVEVDSVAQVRKLKELGGAFLVAEARLYDSTITGNRLEIDTDTQGFNFAFSTTDLATGLPCGPSIVVDAYNIVDKYGGIVSLIGGIGSGIITGMTDLSGNAAIRTVAAGLGTSAVVIGGELAVGMDMGWVTVADLPDLIIPLLGTVGTPGVLAGLASGMLDKYTNGLTGGAVAGIATGGASLFFFAMIQAVSATVEI